MRTLIYVPIIHTSADLGSLAEDVAKRAVANLGEEVWKEHLKTIEGFWDVLSHHCNSLNVSGVKIYQDGMVAENEVAQKIVEEGVRSGSKNYEIVSRLLKKGAVLVKTEDFKLVKEERDRILAITQGSSVLKKLIAYLRYKLTKNSLLNKRDGFIAGRIAETLKEGETGIIFIGAYHNVKKRIPEDIQIIELKKTEKVKAYQKMLLSYKKNEARVRELSNYLVSKEELIQTQ